MPVFLLLSARYSRCSSIKLGADIDVDGRPVDPAGAVGYVTFPFKGGRSVIRSRKWTLFIDSTESWVIKAAHQPYLLATAAPPFGRAGI
jgi:hypothetical protein